MSVDLAQLRAIREWLRFHLAYKLSWPLWKIGRAGERVLDAHHRIIRWGERA